MNKLHGEKKTSRVLIIVFALVVVWLVLHQYAQSNLDQYNSCQENVFISSNSLSQELRQKYGMTAGESSVATFDSTSDQLYRCGQNKLPDWLLFVLGAQPK